MKRLQMVAVLEPEATEATRPGFRPHHGAWPAEHAGVGLEATAQQSNPKLHEFKAQLLYFMGPVSFSKINSQFVCPYPYDGKDDGTYYC